MEIIVVSMKQRLKMVVSMVMVMIVVSMTKMRMKMVVRMIMMMVKEKGIVGWMVMMIHIVVVKN